MYQYMPCNYLAEYSFYVCFQSDDLIVKGLDFCVVFS